MCPTLVVLAAGMGSRFGGLKQVAAVGPAGETLLDYSIFDARRAGFARVVFVVRREIEAEFRSIVGDRYATHLEVSYVHQLLDALPGSHRPPEGRTKPWGTGHAVLAARDAVGGHPFAVINADDFYGAGAFRLLAQFFSAVCSAGPAARRCALVTYPLAQTLSDYGAVSRGLCRIDADGRLIAIEETTGLERAGGGARRREADGSWRFLPADTPVSVNCWGFFPDLFPGLEAKLSAFLMRQGNDLAAEFYLPTAVSELAAEGSVSIELLRTSDTWLGITHREDLPRVRARIGELVAAGVYPSILA
jgi:hypothetical protein